MIMNISILNNYSKLYFNNNTSVLDIAYYYLNEKNSELKTESYNVILLIFYLIIKKILLDNNYNLNLRNNNDNYERILVESYINSYESTSNYEDLIRIYQNNNFRNFLGEYLSNIYPKNLNNLTDKTTINISNSITYKIDTHTTIPLQNLFMDMIINFYYSTFSIVKYQSRFSWTYMCLSLKIILQYIFLLSFIEPKDSALENLISNNDFFVDLIIHLNNLSTELTERTSDLFVNDLISNLSMDSSISDRDASLTYEDAFNELRERGINMRHREFNDLVKKNITFMSNNRKYIYDTFEYQFDETNEFLKLSINYEILILNQQLFYSTYSTFLSSIEKYYLFNIDSNIPTLSSITNNYKHTIKAIEFANEILPSIKEINKYILNDGSLITKNIYSLLIPLFLKNQMNGLETHDNSTPNNQNIFVNNITTHKLKDGIKSTYKMGVTEFNNKKNNSYEGNMPFLFENKNVRPFENLSEYVKYLVEPTSTNAKSYTQRKK